MRPIAALCLALLLVSPFALAEEPVPFDRIPLVSLREAAASGLVSAKGVDPGGYREVTLVVQNRTGRRLAVDLCGSHLVPRPRGSCQRLGLGPAITPNVTLSRGAGTVVLDLEPEQKREVRLNTVCLDAGRPGPGRQVFDASEHELPPVRVKVLRWWADHPTAPQSAVNSAIWRFVDHVDARPGVAENYRRPQGRSVAVHGGAYYRLADGELLSLDTVGIRRVLGTEIFQALPAADGVYAVGLGERRQPELWRLALTGREPWSKVMDLESTSRLLEVLSVGNGNLVLVTDQGVGLLNRAEQHYVHSLRRQQILDISVRRAGKGVLLVSLKVPGERGYEQDGERKGETSDSFELWRVSETTGQADLVKRFWNVRAMLAGEAGVYGLTRSGELRRLRGKNFKTFPAKQSYSRLLAVGRKVVWLTDPDGKLAVADARTGARLRTLDVETDERLAFDLDPVTDDLAFVLDDRFLRARAADGAVEEVFAGED